MCKKLFLAILAVVWVPAWASEPGQPLDCSDWVFNDPGLSCSDAIPYPCATVNAGFCVVGNQGEIDNEGNIYRLQEIRGELASCGNRELIRLKLLRFDGETEDVVGFVDERCLSPANDEVDAISKVGLTFDEVYGKLFMSLVIRASISYEEGRWVAVVDGFATLAEALEDQLPDELKRPAGEGGN